MIVIVSLLIHSKVNDDDDDDVLSFISFRFGGGFTRDWRRVISVFVPERQLVRVHVHIDLDALLSEIEVDVLRCRSGPLRPLSKTVNVVPDGDRFAVSIHALVRVATGREVGPI